MVKFKYLKSVIQYSIEDMLNIFNLFPVDYLDHESISQYLNHLSDFTLQLIRHEVLKHKTPAKRFSFRFVLLRSHKVSVVNKSRILC